MNLRTRLLISALWCTVWLGACAPQVTPQVEPITNDATARTARLLLTEFADDSYRGIRGQPVDPTTLTDLSGYAPINFDHHFTHAISPDGRTMAVMRWPNGMGNAGGVLHLIDLIAWSDQTTEVRLDDHVSDLRFSRDGKNLYWAKPTHRHPAHGMPRDYELHRYELATRTVSVIAKFPTSFTPWWNDTMRFVSTGKRLALVGVPLSSENLAEDTTHVMFVDVDAKRTTADLRIEGVKTGQYYEGVYRVYHPGIAWDSQRDLLYIVHADEDKLTVVDLLANKVAKQVAISKRRSMLDAWGQWLVSTAEAKGAPETVRRVILSHDGKRLYVFSQHKELGNLTSGMLQIVSTDNFTEIYRTDPNRLLTDMALSPDERQLVSISSVFNSEGAVERNQLHILDTLKLTERVPLPVVGAMGISLQGFSPDSQYAYLSQASATWTRGGWSDWKNELRRLELNTQSLEMLREIRGGYMQLLSTR